MKALAASGDDRLIAATDLPEPTPADDEAVIAVAAFSVNRGEFFSLSGVYGQALAAGSVPGQDVAGVVVAAAADGTGPKVGERVVAHAPGGGWAQRAAVPTTAIATLPDEISAEVAATLPLAGLTALRLLRRSGPLRGRRLLLTGASGGVGHLVTELALAAGAEVTAVAGTAERGRVLAGFGARVVSDIATATGPFDVVLESVGGDVFVSALTLLAPGGTVIWFGEASRQPIQLDFFALLGVTPFTLHHFPHWVSDRTDGEDLVELVRLVTADALHPELGRVADWAETATVLRDLANRKIRGNAVLTTDAQA